MAKKNRMDAVLRVRQIKSRVRQDFPIPALSLSRAKRGISITGRLQRTRKSCLMFLPIKSLENQIPPACLLRHSCPPALRSGRARQDFPVPACAGLFFGLFQPVFPGAHVLSGASERLDESF